MSNEQFFVEESISETTPATVQPEEQPKSDTKKLKTVSFSQYAMWLKCPQQWKLSYIDKLAPYEASINTVFGHGIHEALQEYLRLLYGEGGAPAADALDTYALFTKVFDKELKDLKVASAEQVNAIRDEEAKKSPEATKEELDEAIENALDSLGMITEEMVNGFRNDGKIILEHVTSYAIRSKHFPSKKYEVVGIELPLEIPLRKGTILYKGYLDIVLRDRITKKILILDFKTSTFGWNKYQKADRTKIDQLLLYKRFYHQVYKTPMSDIEVEFFVVKRKLYEDVAFPQQRIQRIAPPDGKMSMKEVETAFLDFVSTSFTPEGEYNTEIPYLKNPGKARKNCKYCIFKTLKNDKGELYCDGKEG